MKFINKLIALTLLVSTAQAEYIQPSAVKVSTKSYYPKHSDFSVGEYVYRISWQGIPVASAKVNVDQPDSNGMWKVSAGAKTGDWISVLYSLSFDSESFFSRESFKPKLFTSRQTENQKKKVKEVSFLPGGLIQTKAFKDGKKDETISFQSKNQTLDPISAAFLARSLPIKVGSKKSFDVFNGKHRYLITFFVESKEKLKLNNKGEVECFSVRPEVVKLTDTEGEKRLRSARIWITADDKREVVKLESSVLIGSVKAELERFVPGKDQSQPVTLVKVIH